MIDITKQMRELGPLVYLFDILVYCLQLLDISWNSIQHSRHKANNYVGLLTMQGGGGGHGGGKAGGQGIGGGQTCGGHIIGGGQGGGNAGHGVQHEHPITVCNSLRSTTITSQ